MKSEAGIRGRRNKNIGATRQVAEKFWDQWKSLRITVLTNPMQPVAMA